MVSLLSVHVARADCPDQRVRSVPAQGEHSSEVWPMARKRRHEKPKPVKLFTLNLSTFDKLWMRLLDP